MYTTVRVDFRTRDRLEALKVYRRESFDDVLNKLLSLIPEGDDEGPYADDFRAGLLESLQEAKSGKVSSLSQVKRELGL